jgi:hypothetical protein
MVHSELQILVLLYGWDGAHLLAKDQRPERLRCSFNLSWQRCPKRKASLGRASMFPKENADD